MFDDCESLLKSGKKVEVCQFVGTSIKQYRMQAVKYV